MFEGCTLNDADCVASVTVRFGSVIQYQVFYFKLIENMDMWNIFEEVGIVKCKRTFYVKSKIFILVILT